MDRRESEVGRQGFTAVRVNETKLLGGLRETAEVWCGEQNFMSNITSEQKWQNIVISKHFAKCSWNFVFCHGTSRKNGDCVCAPEHTKKCNYRQKLCIFNDEDSVEDLSRFYTGLTNK